VSETISVEAGYVGNRGGNVFAGDGPATNVNEPILTGFPAVSTNLRRPFFAGNVPNSSGFGGAFGWTQGIDYFCNCAHTRYNSMQVRFTKRLSDGYSITSGYTLQKATQQGGDYFFWDPEVAEGVAEWNRTSIWTFSLVAELPVGRGHRWMSDASPLAELIAGGWQFNTNTVVMSGSPFTVTYRGAGADRDVNANWPNVIGDTDGPQTRDQWFNATPIGDPGSAFARPAAGTFGDLGRNTLRGPGYWRVDASLFKNFDLGANRVLQVRFEAINLFNHVNLWNPDAEVGIPGNANPNAGRINSTAYGNADPQRFIQFGLRVQF
jgi:hypothetical protein